MPDNVTMLTIAETEIFSKYVTDYWSEDERGNFATWIAEHYDAGDVVPGSGGCRKVRLVTQRNRQEWRGSSDLLQHATRRHDLAIADLCKERARRHTSPYIESIEGGNSMTMTDKELQRRDAKRNLGTELLESVRQMKAGRAGKIHKVAIPAVVSARMKSGLPQSAFAKLLGVSVRTLQDWEQGRRQPSGAAKTLIAIAERRPDVLREAA